MGFGKTECPEQLYNMSETEQDRPTANVTISCLYKFMYEISTGATKYARE